MSFCDDEWFNNTDEFNKPAESPGTAGHYNFEPGNIDNIPFNDDGQGELDFDLAVPMDDYQYQEPLTAGDQQQNVAGPSGSGQFQSMHLMQNPETFEHLQPSTSIEYNAFEMPTQIIQSNMEVDPFQDMGIDSNSYYASQQPSTSMGNDMGMNDSYDMMGQQSSSYMPQIDQMNPSSVSNQNSQPGSSSQDMMQMQQHKPKPKKSRPNNKKKAGGSSESVGTVLTKVNKMSQQIGNDGSGQKVVAQMSAEDSMRVGQLLNNIAQLREQGGPDNAKLLRDLEAEMALLFSKSLQPSSDGSNSILSQIQSMTQPSTSSAPPPMQKKPLPKRNRNNQHTKAAQVVQQQQQQQQQMPNQMTPTKLIMEPPTTTMVPSGSNNNYGNENFGGYDQQQPGGQYGDFQQPASHEMQMQPIQAKVVPTQNYRQAVIFNSQTTNRPDPSPQNSIHMDQQYQQDGAQMYVPQDMYQQHQDEPTLGDVVRQTQGRYQGPQDAPNLRQQLLTNVSASTSKMHQNQAPSPYVETYQQPHSQQQQQQQHHMYQEEDFGEFFDMPMQSQHSEVPMVHHDQQYQQHQQQPEMYVPEYSEMPEPVPELDEEELMARAEERREVRGRRVKEFFEDELTRLEQPVDVTPFRGRLDIFQRMLPFHHFLDGEEPVSNFDSMFNKKMHELTGQANLLGNRIRNIVLHDSMRTSTEWEENMLMYLATESERRKLDDDRKAADQDVYAFLQNSDVIGLLRRNCLVKEKVPPTPTHHQDLDLESGQLSTLYKEYEFDSYDENRPRGSPIVYPMYDEEPDSESEPEPEPEPVPEPEAEPSRSDLSPLAGFPQLSPLASPIRERIESESSIEWKDEDESPLLSPETVKFGREVFGDDEDLDKQEPFPFEQIAEVARKHQQAPSQPPRSAESVDSSSDSSSSAASSPRILSAEKSPGKPPILVRENSPELDDAYVSPSPAKVAPIPLPVPLHMIKREKEEAMPKLKLRIPVAVLDIVEPIREPIKLKLNLKQIKEEPSATPPQNVIPEKPADEKPLKILLKPLMEPSPIKTPVKTPVKELVKEKTPIKETPKTHVFKTPLQTPIKSSDSRKRRSEKISEPSTSKKTKETMVTPKNGLVGEERFLKTMTDGRKITMKIGKIPSNINHFVTPRRDGKGNMIKDLSPTKDTRLKMTFRRKAGVLSVEVTERPESEVKADPKEASETTPLLPKARPAPASRKNSVDSSQTKDKKNHVTKNKTAYCNRFNPFANVPTASKAAKAPSPAVALKTPPIVVPKISVTKPEKPIEQKEPIVEKKLSALLPWVSDTDESPERKPKISLKAMPSTSSAHLKVKTEKPDEEKSANSQESPRASSSLSMSFFDDDKGNGFAFLTSPKRTNDPLPVVEFSDDEENDLAHSTFSHATDHLLNTSNMNASVNGAPPILPWSTDP